MEGQHMPGSEPPKVRTRKPKTRDPAVDVNRGSQGGAHGQQPPIRKSTRAAQQQQPAPEVANWDGYANAGPAQAYPEHYGYGDEQYVDAHGYAYGGAQADAHQGYGYGDASQGYGYADAGQQYGYADAGQGYGYGDAGQGYGYGDAGQGYGYGNAGQGYQGYGYGDAQGDEAQGYVAPTQHTAEKKPKKHRKPKPVADGVQPVEHQGSYENQHQGEYGYGQPVQGNHEGSHGSLHRVDEYGQPVQDGYAYPEQYNAAPDPKARKRDPSKSRKPSRDKSLDKGNSGDGAYVDPGNGAHGEPSYGVNYDNGMVPQAGNNPKGRKKNKESQYEDFPVPAEGTPYAESALPSRAIGRVRVEHDGDSGSPRSRTSQEGSQGPAPGRSKSSDREGSGSSRAKPHRDGSVSGCGPARAEIETRSSSEGLTQGGTPRLNPNPNPDPVGRDGSGRSNPEQRSSRSKENKESQGKSVKANPNLNPLNEHMRKTAAQSKPKPAYNDMSMVVFDDPSDRTLIDVKNSKPDRPKDSLEAAPTSALDEYLKKQSELNGGNNFNQQESLIVMPDHDNKEELETQLFGAPLPKKQSTRLPPVVETVDRPQYQPRGDNNQYASAGDKPLYQPVQRRPYAKTPLLPSNEPEAGAYQAGAMEVYDAEGKQIQQAVPNAKCMACVHGIGVPLARIATRIACRQCLTCGCTIL
ncbi:hypothetical protein M758_1G014700 [Ceratodon purpureus]|uniref:Uncharacterized protein n=1 Tax=Ceratodon purpureus TaxID=3225 RepID=A0A8T0J060_CERPU|nr:hypothetical protein KC19_1G015400 [Ceratodon purpureus]KAG0628275.1 hypothetical protein M758_1G014700 [Ceratodon purpureus]